MIVCFKVAAMCSIDFLVSLHLNYIFFFQRDVILYVNRLNTEESIIPYEYE